MPEKHKILLLSTAYLPQIGGSELAIKNITDRIGDVGFDLITAKLDKDSPKQEKIGSVQVYRVGGFLSLLDLIMPKNFLPLSIFFKANSLVRENKYKLVHAYQASEAAGAGWLLKIFYPHLFFMVTMQEGKDLGGQSFLVRFFRKLILKKADYATAISQYLKSYTLSVNKNLNVNVIPNGVDTLRFSKDFSYGEMTALDSKLGLKPDDKVVITVSRLVSKNGIDLLIEAMDHLGTDYKLLVAGSGLLEESLKLQVKRLKLEDRVIFVGEIVQEELPLYYKISDIFVRPSRSEGLGISFLEAMAAGVPIIAPRVGGIPDFLEDRKTGLFSTHDPKDIAFKIRIIMENDRLKEEVVKNALALVREKYNWDKIAEDFRKFYITEV